MKSPLEQILSLEELIRQLLKIDSKLIAGQIILAHRENGKLISMLDQQKRKIIEDEKTNQIKEITLEEMQFIDEIKHILSRIDGFLWSGQILQAYGLNSKAVSILKNKLKEVKNDK